MIDYIHISAGEEAPILSPMFTSGDSITVSLQRLSDDMYWDGSDWIMIETFVPAIDRGEDLFAFFTPQLDRGHYLVKFTNGIDTVDYAHIFSGSYNFTSMLELCLIYGIIVDAFNKPVKNALVKLRAIPSALVYNTSVTIEPKEIFTDEYGGIAMELIRNKEYLLTIPSIGYNKKIAVPDQSSVGLEEL